jgi:hypothetical protein
MTATAFRPETSWSRSCPLLQKSRALPRWDELTQINLPPVPAPDNSRNRFHGPSHEREQRNPDL